MCCGMWNRATAAGGWYLGVEGGGRRRALNQTCDGCLYVYVQGGGGGGTRVGCVVFMVLGVVW